VSFFGPLKLSIELFGSLELSSEFVGFSGRLVSLLGPLE